MANFIDLNSESTKHIKKEVANTAVSIGHNIAFIVENKSTTAKPDNYVSYFFVAASNGAAIQLRNDSKVLIKSMRLHKEYGVYFAPLITNKGTVEIKTASLFTDIVNNVDKLDTELGLDWLQVALRVRSVVEMRRVNAVSTEVTLARLTDWLEALDAIQDTEDRLLIAEFLLNNSVLGWDVLEKKAIIDYIKALQPTTQVATVATNNGSKNTAQQTVSTKE